MKKIFLFFALASSLTFVSTGCSPRMARGLATAAIITGAVVQTAAEIEHARHHRRCRHHRYHYCNTCN